MRRLLRPICWLFGHDLDGAGDIWAVLGAKARHCRVCDYSTIAPPVSDSVYSSRHVFTRYRGRMK